MESLNLWKNDPSLAKVSRLSSYNQETFLNQVRECTALIAEEKERYTANVSAKLDNLDIVPKHIGQLPIDF